MEKPEAKSARAAGKSAGKRFSSLLRNWRAANQSILARSLIESSGRQVKRTIAGDCRLARPRGQRDLWRTMLTALPGESVLLANLLVVVARRRAEREFVAAGND